MACDDKALKFFSKEFFKIFEIAIWVTFTPIPYKLHTVKADTNEQVLLKGLAHNDSKAIESI